MLTFEIFKNEIMLFMRMVNIKEDDSMVTFYTLKIVLRLFCVLGL